jgi:hypothetical protein
MLGKFEYAQLIHRPAIEMFAFLCVLCVLKGYSDGLRPQGICA